MGACCSNNEPKNGNHYLSLGFESWYKGNFVNDKYDGEGNLTIWTDSFDRKIYIGMFKDNKFNGYGVYQYINSNKQFIEYKGQWMSNQRHGQGALTIDNYFKYEGQWKNDIFYGKGKLTIKEKTVKETSRKWKKKIIKNVIYGLQPRYNTYAFAYQFLGVKFENNTNHITYEYEGDFKDHKMSGFGKRYIVADKENNASISVGEFKDGQLNGYITYIYTTDEDIYRDNINIFHIQVGNFMNGIFVTKIHEDVENQVEGMMNMNNSENLKGKEIVSVPKYVGEFEYSVRFNDYFMDKHSTYSYNGYKPERSILEMILQSDIIDKFSTKIEGIKYCNIMVKMKHVKHLANDV